MSGGIDRQQTLRIDCIDCKGNGYVQKGAEQEMCKRCDGSGLLERDVPFKFETNGVWDRDEIANIFEVLPDQVVDKGHDGGEATGPRVNDDE